MKILVPFRSYPSRNIKFQKNSKKGRKIKQCQYGLISGQNRLEKSEKERKQKLLFRFVPTRRVIENLKKKGKKFIKLIKHHYGFISSQNRLEKFKKERK